MYRISGRKLKKAVGNILVVKHQEDGVPIDVEERDKALIYSIVLQ